MFFSKHALERLAGRLASIVSRTEVTQVVAKQRFEVGETHVHIKDLPKRVTIMEGDRQVVGDQVWAVYRRSSQTDQGCVATVMIRGRNQPARGDKRIS
jgi:hypothetical protein